MGVPAPGIEDIVAAQLRRVRAAVTAVENGVGQDDHDAGWAEAFHAASELEVAAEALKDRLGEEVRRRDL